MNPLNRLTDLLIQLGIAGGLGLAVYWWINRQGGLGGGDDSGTETTLKAVDLNGQPLTGAAADNSLLFQGASTGPAGPMTVGPGGTLVAANTEFLFWTVRSTVKNFGDTPLQATAEIQINERQGLGNPDDTWFEFEGGVVTTDLPGSEGLDTQGPALALPVGPPTPMPFTVQPGQTLGPIHGFGCEGALSPEGSAFWFNEGVNEYNMDFRLIEVGSNKVIAARHWERVLIIRRDPA
jgi:hypothetical protein